MRELTASAHCPVCGYDKPHSHSEQDLHIERVARPAFERLFVKRLHLWRRAVENLGHGYGSGGASVVVGPTGASGYPTAFGWNGMARALTFGGDIAYDDTHWSHRRGVNSRYTNEDVELLWQIYFDIHTLAEQSDFRGLKTDEGPQSDAATSPDVLSRQSPVEAALRHALGELFGIGSASRQDDVILTNASNAMRRAHMLSAIEREFFTKTVKDDDGEDWEECSLNSWGSTEAEYIEQFRATLAVAASPSDTSQGVSEAIAILPAPRDEHIAYSDDYGALTAYRVGWKQGQEAYRAALRSEPERYPTGKGGRVNLTPADIEGLTVRSEDHKPATAEETLAVDDALDLIDLPPIRLRKAVFDAIVSEAKACGMVTQAYVRGILGKWAKKKDSPTAPPSDHQILAITTAYEQGFGHGREHRGLPNPYAEAYLVKAWDHGYEEGQRRAFESARKPDVATANVAQVVEVLCNVKTCDRTICRQTGICQDAARPAPQADAWIHMYRQIGGGRHYEMANLGEEHHHQDPDPGFEWYRSRPLFDVPFGELKDAVRYRRLRACHWNDSPIVVAVSKDIRFGGMSISGDDLDEAVDGLPPVVAKP